MFIELHTLSDGKPILLNAKHIVAIIPTDDYVIVVASSIDNGTSDTWRVKESYDDILGLMGYQRKPKLR